jgi:hypothetical protein
MSICMTCCKNKEIRHINLFVFGSEGLLICHECEMKIVEFVRQLTSENINNKKYSLLTNKKNGV